MKDIHEKLGKEKIWKLLFQQSAPAIIGMLIMAIYNFTDTIFVGRWVGTDGIAAVSIVFPIQMIVWAFSLALWIWAASIISRRLGEKRIETVKATFGTFQTTNILLILLLSIIGFLSINKLLILFWATPEIMEMWKQYLSILMVWFVFLWFEMGNNNVIRALGNAKYSMIIMVTSALINLILDYIFIFPLNLWIQWAAWATTISRIVSAIMIIKFFTKKDSIIKTTWNDFKIKTKTLKEIIIIGIPTLTRQIATSGIAIIMNHFLWLFWWSLAIAAYGIINRALMVFMMPMFWIVQGMQPIVWYNHWAKQCQRVKEVTILAIKYLTILCSTITLIYFIYPWFLIEIFSTDPALLLLAKYWIKFVIMMFPIIGFQIIASWFYQSLWRAKPAFYLAILRQVVLFLPILFITTYFFEFSGIRYAFPISDLIAGIIIFIMFYRDLKKLGK